MKRLGMTVLLTIGFLAPALAKNGDATHMTSSSKTSCFHVSSKSKRMVRLRVLNNGLSVLVERFSINHNLTPGQVT